MGNISIVCLSVTGKFGGCRLLGFRALVGEASTVGSLMSCKGYVFLYVVPATSVDRDLRLIDLTVLNGGLEAGILSQCASSMFVPETLTLDFLTTLLVSILYSPELLVRVPDHCGKYPVGQGKMVLQFPQSTIIVYGGID